MSELTPAIENPLNYVLVVSGPVYGSQAARSALLFARALVARGHTLSRVFFYQDGVSNANALTVPANDEFDLVKGWQSLSEQSGCELTTCVAAALRRGMVGEQEAKLHGLAANNLADGYEQAGLGALAESLLTADRVIQF